MNIIYYTCNTHLVEIDEICRKQLLKSGLPIISVSLNKDIDFGDVRIKVNGERSPLMLHKQVAIGLSVSTSKYVFLAESDVMYHPSHFKFTPPTDDKYYINVNLWKMRWQDGFCVRTDNSQQISGTVVNKKLALDFFVHRIDDIDKNGFDRHYEPPEELRVNYQSEFPNICIRHDNNLTKSKWSVEDYRNKDYAKGWQESTIKNIPYWKEII